MVEWLTLVDENDNVVGVDTRDNCHLGNGKMHRAFVAFLFNDKNELLIQRRSQKKLLWPDCWDVSFTSHVYPQESYDDAAQRRMRQELGIGGVRLERALAFTYVARYGDYAENEYCVLLVGRYSGSIRPNLDEVGDYRYAKLRDIMSDMKDNPDAYTPWFKIALESFLTKPSARPFLS